MFIERKEVYMTKKANATCGYCNALIHVSTPYDRRTQTAYCSKEHMVADYLFRTLYADNRIHNKFDITEWKGQGNGAAET
jgi:hypothetical protein